MYIMFKQSMAPNPLQSYIVAGNKYVRKYDTPSYCTSTTTMISMEKYEKKQITTNIQSAGQGKGIKCLHIKHWYQRCNRPAEQFDEQI